jgi:uncharacterized protein YndB with AHSA1/START domain
MLAAVSRYRFTTRVAAPPEQVFDLWTNLDRMKEWVGGVTRVSDVSGPIDQAGTRYKVWFGKMASSTEVLAVQRPTLFRTRFGNRVLRGENETTFQADGNSTILRQQFTVHGLIPRIVARIFATGSYKGSFRGELNEFARIAAREAGGG